MDGAWAVGAGHYDVVTAIVVDPRAAQTQYAISWSLHTNGGGGVYRSDNGGHYWRPMGLSGHAVRALAQVASNPDILIAGAVDGVFRLREIDGKSWDRISPENHVSAQARNCAISIRWRWILRNADVTLYMPARII